jgi:RHS repeat-associated protein
MASTDVAAWGQADVPAQATAIFPPDQIPATPPTSYSRATVHYLDSTGHEVNVAEPDGHISTTEYDSHDNATRELSATNRGRALAAGGSSATQAALLDTHRTFSSPDGLDMQEEWGPQHSVKLNDGSTASARSHTLVSYVNHLPTTSTTSALVTGTDRDSRVTNTEWDTTLRKPLSVTEDVGGKNLKTTTVYDPTNGLEAERRLPRGALGGDAYTTKTLYFTAGTNSADAACSNKPEWVNLPCKTLPPAAQPTTAGLPALPVTTYTYNDLNQVATQTDDVAGVTRTTTTTYDAAGRQTVESLSSSVGTALADVTTTYRSDTGRVWTTQTPYLTISRIYDTLGRVVDYGDANGNHGTTTFDLLGRPVIVTDGKGSQTFSYDATTGLLTGLQDSAAGAFSATYDADDALVSQTYPNGLKATSTYDEAGQRTGLTYVKTTNCSSNCTWMTFSATRDVFGEAVDQDSTLSKQAYGYDGAGRLISVQDTPAGQGCVVREYTYDDDSNRQALRTHAPKPDKSCDPGSTGTSVVHDYDTADRVYGGGYAYDTFGRITAVPAADANGGLLTSDYFVNDLAHSVTQDGITHLYGLDPLRRFRVDVLTGGDGQTRASRYTDDSDSPAWTTESSDGLHWSRNVEGIGGDLAAIQDNQSGTALQLTNLHGDVVAVASLSDTATGPTSTFEADEFGIPRQTSSPRYSWLGGKERATKLQGGLIQMGVRSYLPSLGRFLQVDPVVGGSANDYDYAKQDPINQFDLDGNVTDGDNGRRRQSFCATAVYWTRVPPGCLNRHGTLSLGAALELAAMVIPEAKLGEVAGRIGERLLVRAVERWGKAVGDGKRIEKNIGRGRTISIRVERHGGGKHATKHLQIDTWKTGRQNSESNKTLLHRRVR